MNAKKGDVLFVWGSGLIEEAIEKITDGPAHCALFIDENTLAEANGGRTTGTATFSSYLDDKSNHLEIWGDETLTDEEIDRMVEYAKSKFNLKYDYPAIAAEFVHFEFGVSIDNFEEGDERICSSYVNDCSKSVQHPWSSEKVPAPVSLLKGGKLNRKGVRECSRQMEKGLQELKLV